MIHFIRGLALILGSICVATLAAAEPKDWAQKNLDNLVKLYRELHSHPEISFQERETAARMAEQWKAAGFEVTTGVGGHGVVAVLKNGPGKTLLLRTDLDALPVTEETNLTFASQVKVKTAEGVESGVMHACGHDVHMTNLVGVARFLAAHRDAWKGTLLLIGQPAEERGAGAKAMLDDGLFKRFPKPDYCLALHCDSNMPTGTVGVRGGPVLANVDSIDLTVKGRGGHGAYPHTTIDPIVQAAELVLALQTIESREVKPTVPVVITVGSIHGGTKHNIIGNDCKLQITVRTYSDDVRRQVLDAIRRKAKGIAASYGAPEPEISVSEGTPALHNNEDLANRLLPVFRSTVGADQVLPAEQSMGGEDFGRFGLEGVPLVMYRLGSIDAKRLERFKQIGQPPPSLHSSTYYPDVEDALVTGISTMSAAALELLKQ